MISPYIYSQCSIVNNLEMTFRNDTWHTRNTQLTMNVFWNRELSKWILCAFLKGISGFNQLIYPIWVVYCLAQFKIQWIFSEIISSLRYLMEDIWSHERCQISTVHLIARNLNKTTIILSLLRQCITKNMQKVHIWTKLSNWFSRSVVQK